MRKRSDQIVCHFPSSLNEALEILAETGAQPLAGGTDLIPGWESGIFSFPETVMMLDKIKELKNIKEEGKKIHIGASCTHRMLQESELVMTYHPALAHAASEIGGKQIQNRGSIAGSIATASPAGDIAPCLLIADTEVTVKSAARGERTLPLQQFLLGYRKIDLSSDELITHFTINKLPANHHESWQKLGNRNAQIIAKVSLACRGAIEGDTLTSIAISFGSVAPSALRLKEVENFLTGKKLTPEILVLAEKKTWESISPIDDIRSTAKYRRWVSGRLIRNFLENLEH